MTRPSEEDVDASLRLMREASPQLNTLSPVFYSTAKLLAAEVIAQREEMDALRGAYVVERGKNEFPLPSYSTAAVDALLEELDGHDQTELVGEAMQAVRASRNPPL